MRFISLLENSKGVAKQSDIFIYVPLKIRIILIRIIIKAINITIQTNQQILF